MQQDLIFFRSHNNGLLAPFEDAKQCASALQGIQSQILNAAFVSIFNRCKTCDLAQLNQGLFEHKNLVHTWGQRSTLHLYAAADWKHWIAAQKNRKSWFQRNYSDNPADYQQLKTAVETALADKSRFDRKDLKSISDTFGESVLSAWGGILIALSFEGKVCNLGKSGSLAAYGYTPNWFDASITQVALAEQEANVLILEQYFKRYAPATFEDFCHWRGASKKQAQIWWESALPRLKAWGNAQHFVHHDSPLPSSENRQPFSKLLYRFDPLLLAYHDKTWLAEKQYHPKIWAKAAHVNPVVLQEDGVSAFWNLQKLGKNGLDFHFEALQKLSAEEKERIEEEANKLAVFLERKILQLNFSEAK